MHPDKVITWILGLLAEVAQGADLSSIDPDAPLREQLGMDSVDFLDFVMVLHGRYGIEVPEDDYPELTTLNRCVAYLRPKFERIRSS
jgi:acyl carrier protein